MQHEFWHPRWENDQIGFHQKEGNANLRRHWPAVPAPPGGKVLVPLCGKSPDLLWLRAAGHPVLGVELSPIAVAAFFGENDIAGQSRPHRGGAWWQGAGVELFCGDFFALAAADLDGVAAVYDRAALVAFPEAMRAGYARHLLTVVPPSAPMLLVTLTYPQRQMPGPPFSVAPEEVEEHYADVFSIRELDSRDVLDRERRFREKGLTSLHETAFLLTRK